MFDDIKDIEVYQNESLKKYCTFKIGGLAKYLIIVKTTKALINIVKMCEEKNIKYKVIGRGANLLFSDNGYDGVIIVNRSSKIRIKENILEVDSGCNINFLCQELSKLSLGGLEFSYGIPSSLGGAICNNMGAFGGEIGPLVKSVKILENGKISIISQKKCNFSYRNSIFLQKNAIILSAKLKFETGNPTEIKKNMLANLKRKSDSQPTDVPSAGSVFRRMNEFMPAKVIDLLHMKGTKFGDAMISSKHAGFIVNVGNATSQDVKSLINYIQEKVFFHYSILLQPEIEFVD